MSDAKTRKFHSPEFKAKVGLEAVRGVKTINEIGQEYGVHPVQVGQWKKAIQEQASMLFEGKLGPTPVAAHREPDRLNSELDEAATRRKHPSWPHELLCTITPSLVRT
jgi:transposase